MSAAKPGLGALGTWLAHVAVAAAGTTATFGAVWALTEKDSLLRAFFFERSWVQYVSTAGFWLAMSLLAARAGRLRREQRALDAARKVLEDPAFQGTLIWSDADLVQGKFTQDDLAHHASSLTFSRIVRALDRLRKTQSTNAMQDYCRTRGDIDATELDTQYAEIRFLVWMLPTLGLIGTVMGIGMAFSDFSLVIAQAQDFSAVRQFMPTVSLHLGTAFHTTLLAITLGAIVVLVMSVILKREEQLLSELDTVSFDDLCASFQEHSTSSSELVRALGTGVDQIQERMNGNRGTIERVLYDLPRGIGETLRPALDEVRQGHERLAAEIAGLRDAQARLAREVELARHDPPRVRGARDDGGGTGS